MPINAHVIYTVYASPLHTPVHPYHTHGKDNPQSTSHSALCCCVTSPKLTVVSGPCTMWHYTGGDGGYHNLPTQQHPYTRSPTTTSPAQCLLTKPTSEDDIEAYLGKEITLLVWRDWLGRREERVIAEPKKKVARINTFIPNSISPGRERGC